MCVPEPAVWRKEGLVGSEMNIDCNTKPGPEEAEVWPDSGFRPLAYLAGLFS